MKEKINEALDKLFEKPFIGITVSIVVLFALHRVCGLFTSDIVVSYIIRLVIGIIIFALMSWIRGDRMYSCGLKARGIKSFVVIIPYILIWLFVVTKTVVSTPDISSTLVFGAIVVALEAGIYEEMMVRWIPLGNTLNKKSTFKDMIILAVYTSVLFGLIHYVNIKGFGSFEAATTQVVNAAAAGFALAAVYLRTGSIIPGMVAHALWDFMLFFKPESVVDGKFMPIQDVSGAIAESTQVLTKMGISEEMGAGIVSAVKIVTLMVIVAFEVIYALILIRKSKREEIVKNFTKA